MLTHAPQLMHFFLSIIIFVSFRIIACTGHTPTQAPQYKHLFELFTAVIFSPKNFSKSFIKIGDCIAERVQN